MKPQTFIFIGRSGCGKGTQIELLEDYLKENTSDMDVEIIGTGFELRKFWDEEKGYTRNRSWEINKQGGLQPEFLIIYILAKSLIERMSTNEHLIFDGSPRRLHEAEVLSSALSFYERRKPYVVFMNVSEEWARNKLEKRKRRDDGKEQIEKRLDWYEKDVIPVIEYLKNNPSYNFIEINGEQTIEEVHKEIIKKVFDL